MVKLVFFSYGKLTEQINNIKAAYPSDIDFIIIETTINDVLAVAMEMERRHEGCVFISSGANAEIIMKCDKIKAPFVEIRSTGYDLLTALSNCIGHSDTIGIITFKEKIPYLESVKNVIRLNIEERIYGRMDEINGILDEFLSLGISEVISGSLIGEIARRKGMRAHLLWSEPAVKFAIDQAIHIAKVQKETLGNAERFKAILDFTYEGIVVVDCNRNIEILNSSAEKITGISARNSIGRNIAEVFENMRFDSVINNKSKYINQILEIGDVKILANQVPIIIHDEVVGALATFQHIDVIRKAEEKIRKNLYTKGFVAETRFENIIGKSSILDYVKKEAALYSQTNSTILIKGESGTGKDLFAQSIHNRSARENKPFVAINCAALPTNLLESELFGYEEGAFTGAKRGGKFGVFELAHGGTIFLDEISEISVEMQARLLRVLERKEILRVGGQMIIKVDVRIISATNKDLWEMVQQGKFREDLYYRLNVLELQLPSLKEKKEDIPLLAAHFLRENRKDLKVNAVEKIANSRVLTEYNWPGNVRELKNIIERFSVLYDDDSEAIELMEKVMFIKRSGMQVLHEKASLMELLDECGWNKAKAAKKMGVSRTTIWRKMKEYGLK